VSTASLQRQCFALDLKDDAAVIDRYKHWHRPGGPPAEITRSLRASGIVALDIYLIGNRLFMVMDSDPAASGAKSPDDSDDPHVRSWEALMGELQQDLPFPKRDSNAGRWQLLEHIYSLAEQP
jgi:L-rhamnose mutarotase